MGYKAESLGGYKVKDVADMFSVPTARVQYWAAQKLLFTKGGRITDSSFSKFLADHPEKIPYETLSQDMQQWLSEMGYAGRNGNGNGANAGKQVTGYDSGRTKYASAAESHSVNDGQAFEVT